MFRAAQADPWSRFGSKSANGFRAVRDQNPHKVLLKGLRAAHAQNPPPFEWPISVANDTFVMSFDNSFERSSVSGTCKVWDQVFAYKVLLKGVGGGTIQTHRKVLLKDFGTVHAQNPHNVSSNNHKILKTTCFRYALMMVWYGFQFFEFAGPLAHPPTQPTTHRGGA